MPFNIRHSRDLARLCRISFSVDKNRPDDMMLFLYGMNSGVDIQVTTVGQIYREPWLYFIVDSPGLNAPSSLYSMTVFMVNTKTIPRPEFFQSFQQMRSQK